jgi:hypothetical protein
VRATRLPPLVFEIRALLEDWSFLRIYSELSRPIFFSRGNRGVGTASDPTTHDDALGDRLRRRHRLKWFWHVEVAFSLLIKGV